MAVSTSAIIEHLDLLVDLGCGHLPGLVDALLNLLLLQAESFFSSYRVIPAVATPAHTGLKMMCMVEASPRIAAKLRALI